MPYAKINGINLHYSQQGHGQPLLLLAGMASDMASWQPLLPELLNDFEIITLDNRCCGRTTPMPIATSRSHMVDDVLALLDFLELPRVAVVGHSMGAMLAWAVAAADPHRVTHLIAASAPVATLPMRVDLFKTLAIIRSQIDEADWFRLLFQFLFTSAFFADTQRITDTVSAAMAYPFKQPSDALSKQATALETFIKPPNVHSVTCPVLALTGEYDTLFTVAAMHADYGDMPNVRTAVINNAAHSIHWENSADFAGHIKQFILQSK